MMKEDEIPRLEGGNIGRERKQGSVEGEDEKYEDRMSGDGNKEKSKRRKGF